MPEVYRIQISRSAQRHLRDIEEYIEDRSSGNSAGIVRRILAMIDSLEHLPKRHPVLRDLDTDGVVLRSVPVPPYLVRYRVDDEERVVDIVSIRHGARKKGV